jgi:hypothetical protein
LINKKLQKMSQSNRTGKNFTYYNTIKRNIISIHSIRRPHLFLCLFFFSLVIPPEAWFFIGDFLLSPYRIVLICALVPCVYKLFSRRPRRIIAPDIFILLHVFWVGLALYIWDGLSKSWETLGIYIIEVIGSYLLGRIYIRSAREFANSIHLLIIIVAIMLPFTIVEMLSGDHIIRDLFGKLFGEIPVKDLHPRLGLTRAYGPFQHPILYGVFCASLLGGAFYLLGRARLDMSNLFRSGLVAISAFTSLSTGAWVALVAQVVFITWDRLTRRLAHRWVLLSCAFAGLWIAVDLLSNRAPLQVFLSYLTLNPGTGYTRVLIWEYGSAEVMRHPLFGIGFDDWQRPSWLTGSVDNFWLAVAMRHGIPASILLGLAVVSVAVKMINISRLDAQSLHFRSAWLCTVIGLVIAGGTAHFWNAVFVFFCFMLGAGAWFAEHQERNTK